MDTWEVIRSRKAIRDYADTPVPEPVIRRILQAGRLAGSAKNVQPWTFILVRNKERKQALSRCGYFARHLAHAAFAVVVCTPVDQRRWASFDVGRATQNMVLAAWDQGVGSCVAALHKGGCARSLLKVPESHDIQIAIAFGYPAEGGEGAIQHFVRTQVLRVRGRKPLSELLFYEEWGRRKPEGSVERGKKQGVEHV